MHGFAGKSLDKIFHSVVQKCQERGPLEPVFIQLESAENGILTCDSLRLNYTVLAQITLEDLQRCNFDFRKCIATLSIMPHHNVPVQFQYLNCIYTIKMQEDGKQYLNCNIFDVEKTTSELVVLFACYSIIQCFIADLLEVEPGFICVVLSHLSDDTFIPSIKFFISEWDEQQNKTIVEMPRLKQNLLFVDEVMNSMDSTDKYDYVLDALMHNNQSIKYVQSFFNIKKQNENDEVFETLG